MQNDEASSTSGVPNPLDFNTSSQFSYHEELPSRGYCRIFRAQRYGKWYVLKGLKAEHVADPVYLAMLEKEFATAVTLDHPNIVHTHGIENDEVAGRCIVMEYVEGRTLTQFLSENPSAAKRKQIAMQLLDAMEYFHARQIVHRDLKPSNIVVTHNGDNVKVIDFGLADTDDYAVLKEPAYTKGYAAPEQMSDGSTVDCRTDIFAFGVILSQFFPHRYRRVVRRCTRNDKSDRYQSAAAVKKAIVNADRAIWAVAFLLFIVVIAAAVLLSKRVAKSDTDTVALEQPTDTVTMVVDSNLPITTESDNPQQNTGKPAVEKPFSLDKEKHELQRYADSLFAVWMKNVTDGIYDTYAEADVSKSYMEMLIIERRELMLMNIPTQSEDEYERYWYKLDEVRKSLNSSIDGYMDAHPFPKPDSQYDSPEYKQLCDSLTATSNRSLKIMDESRRRRLGVE